MDLAPGAATSLPAMSRILVVADVPWAMNEVHSALTDPDIQLIDHDDPASAAERARAENVDLAVVDLQVGSMGGMAVTRSLRDSAVLDGRTPIPVVLLLDRAADAFLAKRAGARAWVAKPFTSHQLTTAVATALAAPAGPADPADTAPPTE